MKLTLKQRLEAWADARAGGLPMTKPRMAGPYRDGCDDMLKLLWPVIEAADSAVARYEDAEARNADASLLNRGMTLGVYHTISKALAELERKLE